MPRAERTLSTDIRLVGDALGTVIRAHGGTALFDRVERMRQAAKTARESEDPVESEAARSTLAQEAASCPPDEAIDVVRAFTLYFQLVNLAEDVHRTRELRRREIELGEESIAGSLPAVVRQLASEGATREEVTHAIEAVHLRFVFTAHPTEARRRTTERLLAAARRTLEARDRRVLTPTEERIEDRRLRATIEALWEHAPDRSERPDPIEEVKAGLWYLRHVLLDVVPKVARRLHRALDASFGRWDPLELPSLVRFGSWMGGDRDGNPFITAAITERAIEFGRWIILHRYEEDLEQLVDHLAGTRARLHEHEGLSRAIERTKELLPEVAATAAQRNKDEPLRLFLSLVSARVERTRNSAAGSYHGPDELLEDLLTIRDVLVTARATALSDDALLDLIYRVRCFGFALAKLDVREDARVHRKAIAELLGDPAYPERSDEERIAALAGLNLPAKNAMLSAETRRWLDLFDGLRRLLTRFGEEPLGAYVVTMTESTADVLEVKRVAELYGIDRSLDFVPLFESRAALERARAIVRGLLDNQDYRAHVARRGEVQELLVGYSDSMKEAGTLASRTLVLAAQREARAICVAAGVRLRVFHGRGGSASRGGGPADRGIRALPADAFSPDLKITEQGETRAAHFANPDLAARYLEQTLGAVLASEVKARRSPPVLEARYAAILEKLSQRSFAAYRELVDDPAFLRFFWESTPIEAINTLNMGSRPAKRGKDAPNSLADLRAIPWVFAWSQSRAVITGWYGVGAALERVIAEDGLDVLRETYRESPFLRDLFDNVQMNLAKADLPIAERYARLSTDPEGGARVFAKMTEEFARTKTRLLEVNNETELLAADAVIQRSIKLRNPYVDPLSYLQLEALARVRSESEPEKTRELWRRLARVAVQGIAAGVRNTG